MMLTFSQQVACGMACLFAKQFIHRDLAARNVLVGVVWLPRMGVVSKLLVGDGNNIQGDFSDSRVLCMCINEINAFYFTSHRLQQTRMS